MNVNLFGCLSEIFLEHDHIFKSDFIIFTTIEALSSSIVVPSMNSTKIFDNQDTRKFYFRITIFLDRIVGFFQWNVQRKTVSASNVSSSFSSSAEILKRF